MVLTCTFGLQVQRREADGVISGGPDGFVWASCQPIFELSVPVLGSATRGERGRRRGAVCDGGYCARGVRGARRPRGYGAAAKRNNGGATGDDRRVPPAGQTCPVAAPRRRQLVPGTGCAALRGRPPATKARDRRTTRVPVHGCLEQYASVHRVPVECPRAHRPDRVADEGNTGRRDERQRDGRGQHGRPVQDSHGDAGTGCSAQVQRGQPGVLRGTAVNGCPVRARSAHTGRGHCERE